MEWQTTKLENGENCITSPKSPVVLQIEKHSQSFKLPDEWLRMQPENLQRPWVSLLCHILDIILPETL